MAMKYIQDCRVDISFPATPSTIIGNGIGIDTTYCFIRILSSDSYSVTSRAVTAYLLPYSSRVDELTPGFWWSSSWLSFQCKDL